MAVLIAGAGIGGLTLALSLHQVGIKCRVFEAVDALKPLGVGINLQPHAVRELTELGLLDKLDTIGLRTAEVAYMSSHGKRIWREPRGVAAGYRWPQFSVHRGALQMLLYDAVCERLGKDAIVCGWRVDAWQERGGGIEIEVVGNGDVSERTTIRGEVFVAADGIHSRARAALYPEEGPPSWGGTIMWRGVSRGPSFLTGRSIAMTGTKLCKFVCYPIASDGDGAHINWIADLAKPSDYLWNREDWNRLGSLADFLPAFAAWEFDWLNVPAVIQAAPQVFEYPMVDREPLPAWTHGRMTLLGDAAHAMYPIGSNGASQAILDARVLARELRDQKPTTSALQSYEAERRPATSAIVLANRGDGPDQVLDLVAERAPEGFENIEDVMPHAELERVANAYKAVAGMDVERLNQSPSALEARS